MHHKIIIGDTSGDKTQGIVSFIITAAQTKALCQLLTQTRVLFQSHLTIYLTLIPNSSVVSMYNKWALDTVKGEVYL